MIFDPTHEPTVPSSVTFPVWEWRKTRRLLVEVLVALGRQEQDQELLVLAGELEAERLTPETAADLSARLGARAPVDVRDLLGRALDRIVAGTSLPDLANTDWPINPNWAEIEASPFPVIFHGTVSVQEMTARLIPSNGLDVLYEVCWVGKDMSVEHGDRLSPWDRAGWSLSEAPLVWDWLFVRRMRWLMEQGYVAQPSDEEWPLLLTLKRSLVLAV